ncbi:glutathione S-transferase [Sphingomonas sp. IC-56]|nr:glutathione S-transferase [Sphingomonas sp. IC-56]
MRARLALTVSGTRCELREVTLRAKPAAMLAASPKGTVPVLVLPGDVVIDESLDIMRWALAACDPEEWLKRDDPALIAENDGAFKYALDRYKYPERYAVDPREYRQQGLAFLRHIDLRLAKGGQLCGPVGGLPDAAIVPFVRQFAAVDRLWFDLQPLPHLRAWLSGYLASDLFETIMIRTSAWTPGDLPVLLPNLRERSRS